MPAAVRGALAAIDVDGAGAQAQVMAGPAGPVDFVVRDVIKGAALQPAEPATPGPVPATPLRVRTRAQPALNYAAIRARAAGLGMLETTLNEVIRRVLPVRRQSWG